MIKLNEKEGGGNEMRKEREQNPFACAQACENSPGFGTVVALVLALENNKEWYFAALDYWRELILGSWKD